MTTFDNREKAFEDKFVHDANLQFMTQARCKTMFATWAGEQLGLSNEPLSSYIRSIRQLDLTGEGEETVIRKVKDDFAAKSLAITATDICRKLNECFAQTADPPRTRP